MHMSHLKTNQIKDTHAARQFHCNHTYTHKTHTHTHTQKYILCHGVQPVVLSSLHFNLCFSTSLSLSLSHWIFVYFRNCFNLQLINKSKINYFFHCCGVCVCVCVCLCEEMCV